MEVILNWLILHATKLPVTYNDAMTLPKRVLSMSKSRFLPALVRVVAAGTLLFVVSRPSRSQTLASAAEPAAVEPLATIPLQPYASSRPEFRYLDAIHATVAGQPGLFLLDTGSGVSTISPALAQKAGLHPWGRITGFTGRGTRTAFPHCDEVPFELAGTVLRAPQAGVSDPKDMFGATTPPVDGWIGLDLFAGKTITLLPHRAIVVESPGSLAVRLAMARELPVRLVRDAQGLALTVDAAVKTPEGLAWMELDTGNPMALVIANYLAPFFSLPVDTAKPQPAQVELANGITVPGPAVTADLIMDGNIGAPFFDRCALTLDLEKGRCWVSMLPTPETAK